MPLTRSLKVQDHALRYRTVTKPTPPRVVLNLAMWDSIVTPQSPLAIVAIPGGLPIPLGCRLVMPVLLDNMLPFAVPLLVHCATLADINRKPLQSLVLVALHLLSPTPLAPLVVILVQRPTSFPVPVPIV